MKHTRPRPRPARGFTLVEVMAVVAVVAILAAVAWPSYKEAMLKGRRAQARTALVELLQQQERYRTQYNCYLPFTTNTGTGVATAQAPTPVGACGGVTAASVPFKTWAGDTRPDSNSGYWLEADSCGGGNVSVANCIRVTATPMHADPKVGTLKINSLGGKDCTGTAGSDPATLKQLCWP